MNLIFDPLAQKEYDEALDYYEVQEEGLGAKFRGAVWAALEMLERFPSLGEQVRPEIRRVVLRRFPYKLIYSVIDNDLYVIAVAHSRREPNYWVDRI